LFENKKSSPFRLAPGDISGQEDMALQEVNNDKPKPRKFKPKPKSGNKIKVTKYFEKVKIDGKQTITQGKYKSDLNNDDFSFIERITKKFSTKSGNKITHVTDVEKSQIRAKSTSKSNVVYTESGGIQEETSQLSSIDLSSRLNGDSNTKLKLKSSVKSKSNYVTAASELNNSADTAAELNNISELNEDPNRSKLSIESLNRHKRETKVNSSTRENTLDLITKEVLSLTNASHSGDNTQAKPNRLAGKNVITSSTSIDNKNTVNNNGEYICKNINSNNINITYTLRTPGDNPTPTVKNKIAAEVAVRASPLKCTLKSDDASNLLETLKSNDSNL
jgi:hypothetical protein